MTNWYLGSPPSINGKSAWEALHALERLLPEKIGDLLRRGIKGPAVIAPLIDLGLTLQACENLVGFDNLLARMKQGENAAFSEGHVAAAFVKLGQTPELEPTLNGKRLDTLVYVGNEKVYIEVVTPDQSDVTNQAYAAMQGLAMKLTEQNAGTNVDVYLLTEPSPNISSTILDFVGSLTLSATDVVQEIPGVAYVRYGPFRSDVSAFQPIPNDEELPVLGVASMKTGGSSPTRVNVRCRLSDDRAVRLMNAEAHHFSRDETNILVMDIPHVQDAIRSWTPLIQRRFQPNRHRRFGAVVLLDRVIYKGVVRRRWCVLRNPYAYRPPPQTLLDDIASLDESAYIEAR